LKRKQQTQHDRLVAKLKARGIPHHDAEDAAMVAQRMALEAKGIRDLDAWLFTTAYNYARALHRRKKTAAKHQKALAHHAARIRQEGAPNPLAEAAGHEEREIVSKIVAEALETLTTLNRAILVRHFEMNSTIRELAELFNLTRVAIKGRLHRAKALVRGYLAPRLPGCSDKAA
jgi:RNA polymerase sigma factor (sigma-70 family)